VAAHLQTEILLVDEVLAVGDLQFQAKCLGKMKDTATSGRTVLFVSHNMAAVRQLCPRSLWIDRGRARDFGETPAVVDRYLQEVRGAAAGQACFPADERKPVQLREVHLRSRSGEEAAHFDCDHPVLVELLLEVRRPLPGLYGYLEVLRSDGTAVLVSDSLDCPPNPLDRLPVGVHRVGVTIPARSLAPGDYDVYLNFASSASEAGFDVDAPGVVASFHLDDFTSNRGNRRHGYLSTLLTWRVADAP
jgi:lipopolysaccharide transport system ATP-binding protein